MTPKNTAIERLRKMAQIMHGIGGMNELIEAALKEHDALVQERDALEAQVSDLLRDVVKDAEQEKESPMVEISAERSDYQGGWLHEHGKESQGTKHDNYAGLFRRDGHRISSL